MLEARAPTADRVRLARDRSGSAILGTCWSLVKVVDMPLTISASVAPVQSSAMPPRNAVSLQKAYISQMFPKSMIAILPLVKDVGGNIKS